MNCLKSETSLGNADDFCRRKKVPELLAPAGSEESLRAAVNAGADAVYVGGARFGARAYAENPDEEHLIEGIRYAHLYGAHVHMTVNTLLKESELATLSDYMTPYYEAGLDAAIVQDAGAFSLLHRNFPLLPLHASTQTTVTGPESGLFWKQLGASRLIPARELSLKELTEIKSVTGLEIETFVHGALCYAYSGQCLMSSLIGGRSGNRGRCAQTCRLPYTLTQNGKRKNAEKESYLLSCRDLCSLDLIPALIGAGIDSFKIEGRMKSPRYTAGVVSVWRKYLDRYAAEGAEGFRVETEDRKKLLSLFDRGGQTEGYYFLHNGREMLTLKEKPDFREGDAALNAALDRDYISGQRRLSVRGQAVFRQGEAMRLQVAAETPRGVIYGVAEGAVAEAAQKMGAGEEEVRARLQKTGETAFSFSALDITLEPGLFLPVKQLNELRRAALEALRQNILREYERCPVKAEEQVNTEGQVNMVGARQLGEKKKLTLHVSCETEEQLRAALSSADVSELSFEADALLPEQWADWVSRIQNAGKKAFFALPPIFRAEAREIFGKAQGALLHMEPDGFLLRSLEEPDFLRNLFERAGRTLPPLYFDFQIYGMNREAQRVLHAFGAERLTLPAELNAAELAQLDCEGQELLVAGRLPMMVSAQCLKKTSTGCDRIPGTLILRDRRGMEMQVKNHCAYCMNTILNAQPLSLVGMRDSVMRLKPASVRVLLTTETAAEAVRVVKSCADAFLRNKAAEEPYPHFTRGHMKRGVE